MNPVGRGRSTVGHHIGTLATVLVTVLTFFRSQNKRDVRASVGTAFTSTVDALASGNPTTRMAGAVLLRRFFNEHTEQGTKGTPYVTEAIALIAGMLREEDVQPRIQKVLADGLRYAVDLRRADLQNCNLQNAYLGMKTGDKKVVDLSEADLYDAKCHGASFRNVRLHRTVFNTAKLHGQPWSTPTARAPTSARPNSKRRTSRGRSSAGPKSAVPSSLTRWASHRRSKACWTTRGWVRLGRSCRKSNHRGPGSDDCFADEADDLRQ